MSFKFSVILHTSNSQDFISQSLDSIINQSLDFKRNIQIIVIDDATSDNTINIVKSYQDKFPENISIIEFLKNIYFLIN